jgi:hypothetical protein
MPLLLRHTTTRSRLLTLPLSGTGNIKIGTETECRTGNKSTEIAMEYLTLGSKGIGLRSLLEPRQMAEKALTQ